MKESVRISRGIGALRPDLGQGHLAFQTVEAGEADLPPNSAELGPSSISLSGIQALARLPILQHLRDVAAGRNAAGFVSGYRGSPLGGLDQATFNLAPPLRAERDPRTGQLRERSYGPWMMTAFRVLARFTGVRGTPLDPFGDTADRRLERALIADYEAFLGEVIEALTPHNREAAVSLAALPDDIRGFGHVKDRHVANVKRRQAELTKRFRDLREPLAERGDALPKSDVIMAG